MQRVFRWLVIGIALAGIISSAPLFTVRAQDEVSWLLTQINTLRGNLGLSGYNLNAQLSAAAYQQSQYMVATCDVSHTQSNGSTPASRARANGYTGSWINENIYMGGIATVENAWNFWMNSSIHYQAITNSSVNEVGIGVAYGACGQGYTLVFGYRADVSAPPAVSSSAEDTAAETAAEQVAAAQPVYVPPAPTHTPTPTIPTLTPSATWTITPTHTETPIQSPTTLATATPLILPTVPALQPTASATPLIVAQVPSDTPLPTALPDTPTPTLIPPTPAQTTPGSNHLPGWLPLVMLGGAALLGSAGIALWWRTR